jgi:peptidoglycan-associated lipoprotein
MDRRVISWCLSLSLMLLFVGCSGKKVASSSGDQSSQSGQAKSEAIKPDVIATVPAERSFDRPSGSPTTPSGNVPAGLSPSTPDGSLAGNVSGGNALGDVFFDFDRFQIRQDAVPVLDANARWISANANKTALIEGHCDERGTLAYNLVLGEKRARAAKKYLQDLGVPASQLQITSYGETRPFCKQQNEDCYQQNRRAHFVTK